MFCCLEINLYQHVQVMCEIHSVHCEIHHKISVVTPGTSSLPHGGVSDIPQMDSISEKQRLAYSLVKILPRILIRS